MVKVRASRKASIKNIETQIIENKVNDQESKNNENEKYESMLYLPQPNKKYKLQQKKQNTKEQKNEITLYFLLIEIVSNLPSL